MIWVPGVMGAGGYIPPRTGLSFFIGSTGLQTRGNKLKKGIFLVFSFNVYPPPPYFATLLHLPLLRFHCVVEDAARIEPQECCDFGIDSQTL
jgi:hypothetical protein